MQQVAMEPFRPAATKWSRRNGSDKRCAGSSGKKKQGNTEKIWSEDCVLCSKLLAWPQQIAHKGLPKQSGLAPKCGFGRGWAELCLNWNCNQNLSLAAQTCFFDTSQVSGSELTFAKSTEVLLSALAGVWSGLRQEGAVCGDQRNQYLNIRVADMDSCECLSTFFV